MWSKQQYLTEFLLDTVEVEAIIESNQIDRETEMSESPGPAYAVEIRLCRLGEVKVDDHVDTLNVYASCEEVGAH